MSTDVTLFNNGAGLPAYLADVGGDEGNIVGRETIPQLSYRGKTWRVVIDGEETICLKDDGEPLQTIPVVVLDYNKKRSRAYFPGGYEEGKTAKPSCWSRDSVTPDSNVPEPQSAACASCPQSIKGSKVTDAGKEVTACSQFKNAVVVAPTLPSGWKPLLLKMAQTSLWDKEAAEYEAKGFYAFDNYMDTLLRKGVTHTARVVTKIKFDPRVAYPKLFFGPADWLPAEATADVKALLDDKPTIAKLLNLDLTAEALGVETKPNGEVKAEAAVKFDPKVGQTTIGKAKPPTAVPKPPAPKPNPLAAAADDDDGPVTLTPPTTKPTPAAVAKAKATAVDATPVAKVPADAPKGAGLTNLLTAWDDD